MIQRHRFVVSAGMFLLAILAVVPDAVGQRVYKWVDQDGRVQYTQTPPPDGREVETRDLAQQEVGEDRRRYCAEIHALAVRLAQAAASGVPITVASDQIRQFEVRENIDVDQVALQELVNYVYSSVRRGQYNTGASARAQDACIGGSFGKFGRRSQIAERTREDDQGAGSGVIASGTGWVSHGMVVTNHHVVAGHGRIRVRLNDGRELTATIAHADRENDVVLLRVDGRLPRGLPIAEQEAKIGIDVFTLGFPHTQIMGQNAKLTTGIVSATTGVRDDPRLYQISVPVQSGNSGGPLISYDGEVIGVVTAKLRVDEVYRATGDLTQNVNYAIKSRFVQTLLMASTDAEANLPVLSGPLHELAERLSPAIVLVVVD